MLQPVRKNSRDKRGDNLVYTLTLNPALDYVLKVDKLTFEDINRASESRLTFGGKGINVSAVLTRLKTENTALGFVGGFSGKKLEALLEKEGIKTDFTPFSEGETRINVKIRTGGELDINANSAAVSDEDINSLFKKLESIKKDDYLILAGSVPSSLGSDIYERIMHYLCDKGINFVVDAEGELLLNTLKYKPFLIKPNHHELGNIFNADIKTADEAAPFAKKLQAQGAKNVLVSFAENGALLLDENGKLHKIKNAPGTLVNSVGCGDSMVAGFISGYIETGDFEKALLLATACANATAYSDGLCSAEDIRSIYEILKPDT